jgi:hypothetical protein
LKVTPDFALGLTNSLSMAEAICEDYPERKFDLDLAFGIAVKLTDNVDIDYSRKGIETCDRIMDDLIENRNFNTFDEGVVFGCNIIIDGVEQTEGDPQLLKIFLQDNSPIMSEF